MSTPAGRKLLPCLKSERESMYRRRRLLSTSLMKKPGAAVTPALAARGQAFFQILLLTMLEFFDIVFPRTIGKGGDMSSFKNLAFWAAFFLALSIGGWKAERWMNWKLDYGKRVDQRIERLEQRVAALEAAANNAEAKP